MGQWCEPPALPEDSAVGFGVINISWGTEGLPRAYLMWLDYLFFEVFYFPPCK